MPSVTTDMNHCTPVNLSRTGRIGTMVVPFPGWKLIRRRSQISIIQIMPTGRAIKNHTPQEGWGVIIAKAMMFCGEAIGESMPPILDAKAMPSINAFDIGESAGKLRSMGLTRQ